MQIECATTSAASQVMMTLMDCKLRPGREFHMNGPDLPDPPIFFTLKVDLLPDVVHQLRGIPEANIADAIGT